MPCRHCGSVGAETGITRMGAIFFSGAGDSGTGSSFTGSGETACETKGAALLAWGAGADFKLEISAADAMRSAAICPKRGSGCWPEDESLRCCC